MFTMLQDTTPGPRVAGIADVHRCCRKVVDEGGVDGTGSRQRRVDHRPRAIAGPELSTSETGDAEIIQAATSPRPPSSLKEVRSKGPGRVLFHARGIAQVKHEQGVHQMLGAAPE